MRNYYQYRRSSRHYSKRMIARTWRGTATGANADAYARHFRDQVAPQLKMLTGNRGSYLLRREVGERTEFVALTFWESREAIRAFAGNDIERAHVEPQARAVLAEFDEFADHYEVAFSSSS